MYLWASDWASLRADWISCMKASFCSITSWAMSSSWRISLSADLAVASSSVSSPIIFPFDCSSTKRDDFSSSRVWTSSEIKIISRVLLKGGRYKVIIYHIMNCPSVRSNDLFDSLRLFSKGIGTLKKPRKKMSRSSEVRAFYTLNHRGAPRWLIKTPTQFRGLNLAALQWSRPFPASPFILD